MTTISDTLLKHEIDVERMMKQVLDLNWGSGYSLRIFRKTGNNNWYVTVMYSPNVFKDEELSDYVLEDGVVYQLRTNKPRLIVATYQLLITKLSSK